MGNFLRFIGGLALGFAAGAGITALLTPRAGTEVQDVLRQHVDSALEELRLISGQAPVVTKAKKSIATFKLREGQKIGAMVTLRKERMWEFYDRLVSFALPRVRDFKGISQRSFDGRGNFSMGIKEQIIFPEINYDKIDKIKGLNVSVVTTARSDEEGRALLRYLGMPFRS